MKGKKLFRKKVEEPMNKEQKDSKKTLTDKDLVDALLLISETSKTLALEVMLQEEEGGQSDVEKSNDSQ